jgi:sugar O-acyltransferase (sialic acid O-acetyltransferase NeuD family)
MLPSPIPLLGIYGVQTPSVWSIIDTLEQLGITYVSIDNLGGADPGIPHLTNSLSPEIDSVLIAPAQADARRATLLRALESGAKSFGSLVDSTAVVSSSAIISHGSYINAQVGIGSSSHIGCFCSINRAAVISHHCNLGAFTSTGPGAIMCGQSSTGTGVFLGAGAIILPGRHVGTGATVGAGAVVTKDVPPMTVVAGNPAKTIGESKSKMDEWSCPAC